VISSIGSEVRCFFEGVVEVIRPSQRPGRFEVGVDVGVGTDAEELGRGK
jgi:hypothetical protein